MPPSSKILFSFLVVLCHLLCAHICFCSSGPLPAEVNDKIFQLEVKIDHVQQPNEGDNVSGGITLKGINSPLFIFVAKDDVIIAIAEAKYTESDTTQKYDVVTRYFETKSIADWDSKILTGTDSGWKTQMATKENGKKKEFSKIVAFTVNTNADKIYGFLLNITDQSKDKFNMKFIEGTVNGGQGKLIKWSTQKTESPLSIETVFKKTQEEVTGLNAGDGSVFSLKNNDILFALKGKLNKKTGGDVETVTAYFKLQKIEQTPLTSLDIKTIAGLYSCFQWKGDIFKTPTEDPKCKENKVMVFDEATNTFNDTKEPITRLRDFFKDKSNFVTATIGTNNNVLLFTQKQKSKTESGGKNDAHLWMTDGNRVGYVGTIITKLTGEFYGSVLYTKNELFALCKTCKVNGNTNDNKPALIKLKEQLSEIRKNLDAWNKSNNEIKKLFENAATITTLTDGLVGYLSGNGQGNDSWEDEYLYVSANVITKPEGKAERVTDGFKFSGKGVGATWPVGKPKEEQRYNFTDLGFTLVAFAKIDSNAKDAHNSVLGVLVKETEDAVEIKPVGVLCSSGKKWALGFGGINNLKESQNECEEENTYAVALVLRENKIIVYVDREELMNLDNNANIEKPKTITHFYLGAESVTQQQSRSDATITNVLLYNRPLAEEEIKKLKVTAKIKKNTQPPPEKNDRTTQDLEGSKIETSTSSGTSATPTATEKDGAEIKLCLRSMNTVTVLSLLFNVFTLLGRYVY